VRLEYEHWLKRAEDDIVQARNEVDCYWEKLSKEREAWEIQVKLNNDIESKLATIKKEFAV
jgi:hypothetical protein